MLTSESQALWPSSHLPCGSTSGFTIVRDYHLQTLPPLAYGISSEAHGYHLWTYADIVEQGYHLWSYTGRAKLPPLNSYHYLAIVKCWRGDIGCRSQSQAWFVGLILSVGRRSEGGGGLSWNNGFVDKVVYCVRSLGQVTRSGDQVITIASSIGRELRQVCR